METLHAQLLFDGFTYGEGPRWHDGKLWFADQHEHVIRTIDEGGKVEVAVEIDHPSGLGWGTDGALYVSTIGQPILKRVDAEGITVVQDFSDRGWSMNDMVAGPDGRIYLDLYHGTKGGPPPGDIILVTPDGEARTVATDLATPNGLGITPDRSTLVVSETFSGKLLAYTIEPDGGLTDARVFADLGPERGPDGLCFDAEGAVWVGSSFTGEFLRVLDGGEITHVVHVPGDWAVATALGGADRRTLYLVVADTDLTRHPRGESKGRIETVRVDVPGAGWP